MTRFDRSGIAAQSDLVSPEWKIIYDILDREQSAYLKNEGKFIGQDYKWPADALHNWSRVWEYPYVYYHLKSLIAKDAGTLKIVDLGSGVTFFPFSLAKLGFEVTCCDIDPVCRPALAKASEIVSAAPGRVEFKLIESENLPLEDRSIDALYCVSVLEHIQNYEHTIREIVRVIKPGGQLLLTLDLDLRGDLELGKNSFNLLQDLLVQHFDWVFPEQTIHPRDILDSYSGPFPFTNPRGVGLVFEIVKQMVAKPLLGRRPGFVKKAHLAVYSAVLTKK